VIASLIAAEVLKLVRRRALMLTALAFMLGSVLVILAVRALKYTPTGGESGYTGCMYAIISLGGLVATAIGSTAGSQDHSAGVFRDLVATGVSRLKLFAVRVPGALLVVLGLVGPAYLVAVAAGYALAGGETRLSFGVIRHDLGYLALLLGTLAVLGCAFSTLAGSRGWVIGGLIVLEWVVQPLLTHIDQLGRMRDWLLGPAVDHFAREELGRYNEHELSASQAWITIAVWMGVALCIGAWRAATRDT
jgi:ABC-type transport system involved in multi-copper enzyme maturation permease subunit